MEQLILYNYLRYQKKINASIYKDILKLPKSAMLLLAGTLLSYIFCAVTLFVTELSYLSWFSIMIEILFVIGIYFYTEYFEVKNSCVKLDNYICYCKGLKEWLISETHLTNECFTILQDRMLNYKIRLMNERKAATERIEKWFQILAVPVVLAIITTIINHQAYAVQAAGIVVGIIMSFLMLCGVGVLIRGIIWFPKKKKIEQIECLLQDVTSIIDIENFQK